MSSFDARIHLPGQTRLPVNVVVDISDDRIKFVKDGKPLGDWSLDEVGFDLRRDAIYLKIDDEEIALKVTDVTGFAGAMNTRVKPAAPGVSAPSTTPAVVDQTPPEKGLRAVSAASTRKRISTRSAIASTSWPVIWRTIRCLRLRSSGDGCVSSRRSMFDMAREPCPRRFSTV